MVQLMRTRRTLLIYLTVRPLPVELVERYFLRNMDAECESTDQTVEKELVRAQSLNSAVLCRTSA